MHRLRMILIALALPAGLTAQSGDTPLSYADYAAIAAQIDPAKHVVDIETFLRRREDGAVVIDLRNPDKYAAGHLPGALHLDSTNITANALAALIVDPAQLVLIYCDNSLMPTRMISLTDIALPQFITHGYEAVFMTGFMGLSPALADGRLDMVQD